MPQMAPIKWLTLFIVFSIVFMLFCSINYYMYMPSSPKSIYLKNKFMNSMNWKW